jgi:hypothetical protein
LLHDAARRSGSQHQVMVQDSAVPSEPVRRLTIELDATAPVRGRVLADPGSPTSFAGWLDLMTVLQSLCAGTPVADLVEPPR